MAARMWPHLNNAEYKRRVAVIADHFPAFIPALALAEDGVEAGLERYQDLLDAAPALALRETFTRFVRQVVHSSVDLIYTSDGLNHGDRNEVQKAFDEACQEAFAGRRPATIATLIEHVAKQCRVTLPNDSEGEQMAALRSALVGDESLPYAGDSPLLSSERQLVIVDADPRAGEGYTSAIRDSSWVARNWSTEPALLKRLSSHPSRYVLSAVLSNPMAPPGILAVGLAMLPYPTELWARIDEEEGGSYEVPEWAAEEIDETDPLVWSEILVSNPMIGPEVITSLGNKIAGHLKEHDVLVDMLLHPNCPTSLIEAEFEQAAWGDWQLLCIAANPKTPPVILSKMALLEGSSSLNLVENLDVTMNDVLVGVATNPSTPLESRALLATIGNEKVGRALRATAAAYA